MNQGTIQENIGLLIFGLMLILTIIWILVVLVYLLIKLIQKIIFQWNKEKTISGLLCYMMRMLLNSVVIILVGSGFVAFLGKIDVSTWVILSTIIGTLEYLLSTEFVEKFFHLSDDKVNSQKVFFVKLSLIFWGCFLVLTMLIFPAQKDFSKEYTSSDLNNYKAYSFKYDNKNYSSAYSEGSTIILKNRIGEKRLNDYDNNGILKRLWYDIQNKNIILVTRTKGETESNERVIEDIKTLNDRTSYSTNLLLREIFYRCFVSGFSRFIVASFLTEVAYVVMLISSSKVYKWFGGDENIIPLQGAWYLVNHYPIENQPYLYTLPSFYIRGSGLLVDGKSIGRLTFEEEKGTYHIEFNNKESTSYEDIHFEFDENEKSLTVKNNMHKFISQKSNMYKQLHQNYKAEKKNKFYLKEQINGKETIFSPKSEYIYEITDIQVIETKGKKQVYFRLNRGRKDEYAVGKSFTTGVFKVENDNIFKINGRTFIKYQGTKGNDI